MEYIIIFLSIIFLVYLNRDLIKNRNIKLKHSISVLLIIVSVYLVIYIVSKLTAYPNNELVGTQDGWLAFTGGIIGSIVTMSGIIITIKYQETRERKKVIYESCPNLYAKDRPNESLFFELSQHIGKAPISVFYDIELEVKCASNTVATDISFLGYDVKVSKIVDDNHYMGRTFGIKQIGNVAYKDDSIKLDIPANIEYPFYQPIPILDRFSSTIIFYVYFRYKNLLGTEYILKTEVSTEILFYNSIYTEDGKIKSGDCNISVSRNKYKLCYEDEVGNIGYKSHCNIKNYTVIDKEEQKKIIELDYIHSS